jgi:probable HAF family extracellular repeat protein
VAGQSFTADKPNSDAHAFLWQDGTMTDLSTTLGGTDLGDGARGINNNGQAVGFIFQRAAMWIGF